MKKRRETNAVNAAGEERGGNAEMPLVLGASIVSSTLALGALTLYFAA